MELKVISADDHIFEAPDAYQKRRPKKLKDAAPRVVTSADGIDTWVCDGEARPGRGWTSWVDSRPWPERGPRTTATHRSRADQAMPLGFYDAGERTQSWAVSVRPWRASSRQART